MGEAVLLVIVFVFFKITGSHLCLKDELEKKCLTVLKSVFESDELALATTKHEVEFVCRKLHEGMECIDVYSARCFDSAQLGVYHSVVSDSRQVIESLCIEGKFQEDYLKFAPCFKSIATDTRKCATKYRTIASFSRNLKDYSDKDSALKSFCCALKDFTICQHEHSIRDCGRQASQFLQNNTDRMSGSLLNEHCVVYTYEPGSCSSVPNSKMLIYVQRALFVVCYLFVFLFYG